MRLYKRLQWFTWGFYTSVCQQVQTLWGACLSHRDKSSLWCHRTSTAVVNLLFCAICAAAWFAKVPVRLYTRLERFTWGFYIPVCHQVQTLWGACLSHRDKSLLWCRRTSIAVVNLLFCAIRAAAWFAKVCWTLISVAYEVLNEPLPSSLSPDHATDLEPRGKLPGRWITESDPALFSPNDAPVSPVESTPWSTTCSPESQPPLQLEKQISVSHGRKKSEPQPPAPPQSVSSTFSSLTVKEVVKTKGKPDRFSLGPVYAPMLAPSISYRPVEGSIRKNAPPRIPVKDTVKPSSRKSLKIKARPTADPPGVSMLSSLARTSVSRQEATARVPSLTVTCPTPPQQIQSTTTIDQSLLHTDWSPSVAAPNSNEPNLQSGTGPARQAGVSTAEGTALRYSTNLIRTHCSVVDSLAHAQSRQTQQMSAQGKQHPSPSVVAPTVSLWPTALQAGCLATTVQQVASNVDGWSLLVPPF